VPCRIWGDDMAVRPVKNMTAKGVLMACAAVSAISYMGFYANAAIAQSNAQAQTYDFNLPAQSLAQALLKIGEIAGIQVLYADSDTPRVEVGAIKGRMSVDEALARTLSGTGYSYQYTRPGVITLIKSAAGSGGNGDGERLLGAVRVEGAQGGGSPYFGGAGQAAGVNGVNGSRDITATEGTGSFTSGALTIGSKVPQAMKDIPQSLSVLTNARMEQQNITDLTDVMRNMTGVALVQGTNSLDQRFYSRGFEITSFQVDGGAALSMGRFGANDYNYRPQMDMSQYDHVELLRGAAGTFNGYGDPSGTVNLVRKKPLDHQQLAVELQAGSWNNYRVALDGTTPLTRDGKLRTRVVYTFQDNEYFYAIARDRKTMLYNINEFDLTPSTLLTAGVSVTHQKSVPWEGGLPRYQNGGDLALSRSTCLCFPWNRAESDTTEIFGSVEQRIGRDWTAKINLTRNVQSSFRKLGNINGTPVNSVDASGPRLAGSFTSTGTHQVSVEGTLSGAFSIFGERQEITIGVNRGNSNADGRFNYLPLIVDGSPQTPYQPYLGGPLYCYSDSSEDPCPAGSVGPQTPLINVFNFDPYSRVYSEPSNPLANRKFLDAGNIVTNAYVNLRLTAFKRAHLTTAIRWSQYRSVYNTQVLCTVIPTSGTPSADNCVGRKIGDVRADQYVYPIYYKNNNISWPPSVSVSYDITKSITGYVGYTDIYQDQSTNIDYETGKSSAPLTGSNWEAGVKWAARDGRLNISVSAYDIRKRGYLMIDDRAWVYDSDGNFLRIQDATGVAWYTATGGPQGDGIHSCCYMSRQDQAYRSRGFDVDVAGEILSGWQISASYTYNKNRYEGTGFGRRNGMSFLTISPTGLPKLWTGYDFGAGGAAGWLSGLNVSAGVNGQSSGYYSGSVCVTPSANPDPITHEAPCIDDPNKTTDGYQPYAFTTRPYAVVSARFDYRFSNNISASLNIENLLDKTYYSGVGDVGSGNWYGAPRSITASLRAKW
jgi:outer-membrane receptor for ferric coprogen and ferric-rhodotorulic acid